MAQKHWVWNKFYGGLSDNTSIVSSSDQTKWSNESFGVDGRSNPEGIQLASYYTTAETLVDGNITCFLDLAELGTAVLNSSGVISCTDTGNIYLDGVLKHTVGGTAASKKIEAISFIGSTIYYFSGNGDIHKSDSAMTTFADIWKTFSIVLNVKPVAYKHNNLIYIATLYNVYTFDGTFVSASPVFILDNAFKIVGITFWQSYMNIYGTNAINGIKAMWDPESGDDAPSFVVPYNGKPIIGISGEASIDYAVIGSSENYADFCAIQGTSQPQLLVSNTEGNVNVRKFSGIMATRNGLTYLGGTINGNGALFSYGKKINGFPNSLQVEAYSNSVTAILARETQIRFGNYKAGDANPYRNGVILLGDNTGESKYTDVGYVVSLPFTGGKRNKKSFIDCEICFKTDSLSSYDKRGGNVTVYARTTPSGSWTTIKTINTTTETDGFVFISQQEMGELASFNQMQWQLRLEYAYDGARYSISPLISSLDTRYDDGVQGS